MPNATVPAAARGLPRPSTLFLEITPEIRRALALLAEASISLLDEIDAPTQDLEEGGDDEPSLGWVTDDRGCLISCASTDDRELECEDEGAQCDDEGAADTDLEPNLGWTLDSRCDGGDGEDDIVAPETSGGFRSFGWRSPEEWTAAKCAFDPRLLARPKLVDDLSDPTDNRRYVAWVASGVRRIPPFPHESPDRPAFVLASELERLRSRLRPKARLRRRRR